MLKSFSSFFLMPLLSFALCIYFPWWAIAPACFLISALIPLKPWQSLLLGFISMFLLWLGMSWWISTANSHILAHRISLLILKSDNSYGLMLLTASIGGVVGGLSALTGSLMARLFSKK